MQSPWGSRAGQKAKEVEIASRIAALPVQEWLDTWVRETGKSQAALYRRLEEAKRSSSQFFSLSVDEGSVMTAESEK